MINVNKAICLDENLIFPNCHICKKELSPFFISDEELLKFDDDTLAHFYLTKLLIKHKDKNIIYLCTNCLKSEKIS